jgi:hypothetical protein
MISHAEKVESYFGYWPLFCDGKITNLAFAQPGTITLVVAYIDSERHRGAEVSLKFSGVTEVELSELRSENVIDALRIPEELPAQVTLEACYGLAGSFRCAAVEVSSVMPNPSINTDAAR